MIKFADHLNPEQFEAVKHIESPLLVFAGAGTGKTRVITYKIAWLIQNAGLSPASILAVTFTNRAAGEMRERVADLLGRKAVKGLTVSTFHAFGVQLLRKFIDRIGYTSKFNIYDESEQLSVITGILTEMSLDPKQVSPKLVQWAIGKMKNNLGEFDSSDIKPLFKNIRKRYDQVLKNCNALDFDDLISKPIDLLEKDAEVREYCRKKFKYVLIDEYQDTNPVQYQFIKLMLNPGEHICAVGDDDQSIYGWRGSDIGIILNFRRDFKNSKVMHLMRNYRSVTTILEAAHGVISKNIKREQKKLWSDRGPGEPLLHMTCCDEEDEAEQTARKIMEYSTSLRIPFSGFAVLYRTNFQSRPVEMALRSLRIPYKLIGGINFFDRKEVRDILSYLKVISNPKDEMNLLRIINYPHRNIGDATVAKVRQHAALLKKPVFEILAGHGSDLELRPETRNALKGFADLIENYRRIFFSESADFAETGRKLIDELEYEDALIDEGLEPEKVQRKMMNLSEVVNSLKTFRRDEPEGSLFDYLSRVALMNDNDGDEEKEKKERDQVKLMTVHSAKGLEFDCVIIIGLEEDLFPHKRSVSDNTDSIEEERRLFYVALTRGRRQVILMSALKRKVFGKETEHEPSRFLQDIPASCLKSTALEPDRELSSEEKLQFMNDLVSRLSPKT